MKKILLAVLLMGCTGVFAQSQFINATGWDEIFATAQKENKLVFIDCYFEGCHPCKQMDDEVFPLEAVNGLMKENFISTRFDCLKEDLGKSIQVKYGITGFPTYLILDSKGRLINYFSGYKEADKFIILLQDAIALNKKNVYLGGFSSSLNVDYPDFYTASYQERKSISADSLAAYIRQSNDKLSESCIMPLLVSRAALTPVQEDYVLEHYNELAALYGRDLVASQRMRIISRRIKAAPVAADETWFAGFMAKMKDLCSAADWPYLQLDIAEAYYYNHLKDHKAFFHYAIKHANDDDNKVRYMGMYLAMPGVDTAEKNLYARWMKLVLTRQSSLEALRNAASLMLQQKDKAAARQYAQWALDKAKMNHMETKYLEEMLAKTS